ncbi:Effector protein yopJ (Virulence factor yopJ) [Bartonella clarridgeiae 73]|uniref:Effector protein yopJ (Virulence factor yopJ) n=1 Tax=Bartonella clarridgeiae (strain CCUG 45776 / CIP 104772 / 73) TaxID=696125 RepID=E6YGE3_BARC7|nr:YopJ/AvrA family T3SS effector serine/threonine acetyltransferase [Bartonella clarridgeiae]WCR55463.1 MAG: Type III secretion injected virulence protein (YopP YopJ induces apoptosis prevents cytokine induction inhibits NFkb activation) [Bartonella clarridgeiae]CBI75931.1 Effector protein yopJ (Virulence factor yopJ) [Bartonella clarridgeiae 73]
MQRLLNAIKNAIGLPNTEDSFSNASLENIITDLENDIANNYWHNRVYAERDFKMMPALVKQANDKYPEMNLKLIKEPIDFVSSFKKTIKKGIQSSRYIVSAGGDYQSHFGVVDHQTLNNKISLILFEPARFDLTKPAILGAKMQIIMETRLSHCYFSMAEMDIQRSISECGIFSLAIAKKLYRQSDKLEKLHIDNIKGDQWDRGIHLSYNLLDKYLPVSFYKHTQGMRRIKEYIEKNPGSEDEIVNKKNQTIVERFEENLVILPSKSISVSIHKKRVSEYKSLMR